MYLNIRRLRSADWILIIVLFALMAFGLAAIYSVALSKGADFLNLKKQIGAAILALAAFVFIAISNYRLLRNYSLFFYISGVLMLIGVLLLGSTIRGTTGWFQLGIVSFQPVEFMKVALVIALATYFSQRARREIGFKEVIESGLIAFVPVMLTLVQPDFGSASLLFGVWFLLLLFAGLKKQHLAVILIGFAIIATLGWSLLAQYQQARVLSFLNPTADPLGQGYHINQAIIAVGAGGLLGRGLGFGSQSQLKFLPESQTDFIFAVIAEELGFLGIILVLSGFFLLFARILTHAKATDDDFTSFLLLGIGGVLFTQFFVNVGMNLGLLPVTGVALPLVSYGGSSLLFTIIMLGIIQSIVIHKKTTKPF